MNKFFFEKTVTDNELMLLRISLAITMILPIFFGQYNSFIIDSFPYLLEQNNIITHLFFSNYLLFESLKWLTVASVLIFAVGVRTVYWGLVASITFCLLDYLSFSVESHSWNFTTHIQFFVFLLSFSGLGRKEVNSFIIRVMQIYICMLYFQAGISKVIYGGLEWLTSGDTIFVMTYFHGTFLGKMLLPYKSVFVLFSAFAVLFELLVPFLFVSLRNKNMFGLSLIVFHLVIYSVLRVAFWQLFILYPLLFKQEKLNECDISS